MCFSNRNEEDLYVILPPATKTKAVSVMYTGSAAGEKALDCEISETEADRFCRRHHRLMDEIHSMWVIMFKSNLLNLTVAYNYFSTRCCEDGTKNGLIFTLWSISSDAACLTLTSCCDTAFLMPLTILNDIDNKARQDQPLRQQAGFFFSFFFHFQL